jgi:hypothetical protein
VVDAAKVEGDPDQVTVPVYPVPAVVVVTGVAPVTGAVTPAMAGVEIVVLVGVGVGVGVGVDCVKGADTGANLGIDAGDEGEAPLLFTATTENEYIFPGVSPEILASFIWSGLYVALTSPAFDVTR